MASHSISSLILRVRRMADVVNNTNATTSAEVQQYLWNSLSELRSNVTQFTGQDWWLSVTPSFTTVAGTASYALTAGGTPIFQIKGIDTNVGSASWIPSSPYNFADRGKYASADSVSYPYWNSSVQYRITSRPNVSSGTLTVVSTRIQFIPTPTTQYQFRAWYVPDIDFSTVTVFSGTPPLWDEYMVIDSAIKVLERDEQDTQQLMNRRKRIEETVLRQASDRDFGFPESIQDTSRLREP